MKFEARKLRKNRSGTKLLSPPNGTFSRYLKFVRYRRGDIRAAVKHLFFFLPGLAWTETDYSIYFIIPASNMLFDGLVSKKISFSFHICHQTVDLMTELWNICTNLFLPKQAQSEQKRIIDCSRLSNLGDQLADSLILNKLKSAWKRPITHEPSLIKNLGRGYTKRCVYSLWHITCFLIKELELTIANNSCLTRSRLV